MNNLPRLTKDETHMLLVVLAHAYLIADGSGIHFYDIVPTVFREGMDMDLIVELEQHFRYHLSKDDDFIVYDDRYWDEEEECFFYWKKQSNRKDY